MSHLFLLNIFIALMSNLGFDTDRVPGEIRVQEGKCIDCHKSLLENAVMHPVVEDACDNCHQPTGESHPQEGTPGFILADEMPALCYYCHQSISQLMSSNKKVHSAIIDGGCILCHQPHGAEYNALLIDQYPEEMYVPAKTENFGICFMCHNSEIINDEETDWATNFRNGVRNLHQLHINGEKGRNCNLCHNMHGSANEYLIEERVQFGNWEMRMNFLPLENGGSCLPGCHGMQSYVR